jgi:hypothetical protein
MKCLDVGDPARYQGHQKRIKTMKNNKIEGGREMKEKSGYSAGPFTVDEIGFIQIAQTKVLAAVARGEIDLNRVAREEMANRGLGLHGEWVGFQKARTIHRLDQ